MRIKITVAFTDKQAKDPAEAEVPAGKELAVTAERGAELIGLRIAVEIPERATSKPAARKAKPASKPKAKQQPAVVPGEPVPASAADPLPPAEPAAS
jgi:hypothetical protein